MIKRIHPIIRVRRNAAEADYPQLDGGWIPRLDLAETEKALVVAMEASGLAAEDLLISLQPNRIEIKGRKMESAVPPGARYLRLEREYGPFRRTLALPRSVVPVRARATLRNGVLTIVLPKPPVSRTRRRVVPIKKTTE
ncbi:MAG: Hsp20/alpha crystallin family protein [Candidatus Aminicenantales bacterium]